MAAQKEGNLGRSERSVAEKKVDILQRALRHHPESVEIIGLLIDSTKVFEDLDQTKARYEVRLVASWICEVRQSFLHIHPSTLTRDSTLDLHWSFESRCCLSSNTSSCLPYDASSHLQLIRIWQMLGWSIGVYRLFAQNTREIDQSQFTYNLIFSINTAT